MTTIPTLITPLRPIPAAGWTGYYGLLASDRSIYMGSPFSTAGDVRRSRPAEPIYG
ncbi:hypothetical protein [Roseibium sp.]|uniref:hypothetical protein n=1 Tax=Roseibium sp. TaxID=1936156 RepID=UPI0032641854